MGAAWAAYTWRAQWLDHLKNQNEAKEEERLAHKAALQVEISAKQARPPQEKGLFIAGDVIIKNVGTKPETIKFNDGPLFMARVDSISSGTSDLRDADHTTTKACQDGHTTLEKAKKFWLSRPQLPDRPDIELGDELRPGATDVFHFLLRVGRPGTYALMFSLNAPNEPDAQEVAVLNPCLDETRKDRNRNYRNRWESPASFVEVRELALPRQ